jgi:hypothetical protein
MIQDPGGITYPPRIFLEEPAPCPRTLALVSNPQQSSLQMHGVARDQNPAIGRAPNLEKSSHQRGDALDLPKPNRTFRFSFQNIQNILSDLMPTTMYGQDLSMLCSGVEAWSKYVLPSILTLPPELPATKTLKPFLLKEYGHPHPLTARQQGTLDLAKSSLAKQITA